MSGMNLEVWFPQQAEVTVFLESAFADPLEEPTAEIHLFTLYACRQIANLRGELSLCSALAGIDRIAPLAHVEQLLDDVTVGSPRARGGARGFTVEYRPGPRFKLKGHGFGMLGKGIGYYAPTSTLAFLLWLLRRRHDDEDFCTALAVAAATVGELGQHGQITVTSQTDAAAHATMTGIEAMGETPVTAEALDVSEAAAEAIAAHNIDFSELVELAGAHVSEMTRDTEQKLGSMFALPTEYCLYMCRMFIFAAAVPETDPTFTAVMKAQEALSAARQTGNTELTKAAETHHQQVLAAAIDDRGLEPLVPELNRRLFTTGDGEPG
jgi:hypothetical protein